MRPAATPASDRMTRMRRLINVVPVALTPFFAALAFHVLVRAVTIWLQHDRPGFRRAYEQPVTGLLNDLIVCGGLALISAAAGLLAVRTCPTDAGRSRLLILPAALFLTLAVLVTGNLIHVGVTGTNVFPRDLQQLKMLPLLTGYLAGALTPALLAAAAGILLALVLSAILFQISLRHGARTFARNGRAVGVAALIVPLAGIAATFKPAVLEHVIAYEPAETHVVPFLVHRLWLESTFQMQRPDAGIESLRKQLSSLGATGMNDPFRPSRHLRDFRRDAVRPLPADTNVVVIMLESLGRPLLDEKPDRAPFLMAVRDRGVSLERHYTTLRRTVGAQFSFLCSLYDPPQFFVGWTYPQVNLRCLPSVLARAGFSTTFVTGAHAGFDAQADWMKTNGMQRIVVAADYPPDVPRYVYGVHDGPMFDRALEMIDSAPKPAFVYVQTLSNHVPNEVPKDFLDQHPKIASWPPNEQTVFYMDAMLAQFFEGAKEHDWYARTLFVLVGDHAPWNGVRDAVDYAGARDRFRVYGALVHPELGAGHIDWDTSVIDIPPTVLALLGASAETDFVGLDVFTATENRAFGAQEHSRGDAFIVHDTQEVVFRDPASGQCDALMAELPKKRRPCTNAQREKADGFARTYYDTTRWSVVEADLSGAAD